MVFKALDRSKFKICIIIIVSWKPHAGPYLDSRARVFSVVIGINFQADARFFPPLGFEPGALG